MAKYLIRYRQTEYRRIVVDADDLRDAILCWENGEGDDQFDMAEDAVILATERMD